MKKSQEQYGVKMASEDDIDELEKLYDNLNDYLELNINYSGWKKGIYPIRETAKAGIEDRSLFIIRKNNEIAGSVILNHNQDLAYFHADWNVNVDDDKVMVVHTLAVNPKYMRQGISRSLMEFTRKYSLSLGMKAIRLDVSVENTPAIELYESLGYTYIDTVDLGLKDLDRVWFRLYEYDIKESFTRK